MPAQDLESKRFHARHGSSLNTLEQQFIIPYGFPILFTRDSCQKGNAIWERVFGRGTLRDARILLCVDEGLDRANPAFVPELAARLRKVPGLTVVDEFLTVPGGDAAKDGLDIVRRVGEAAAVNRIDRHSFVLAIGGGAVLDAVGLAAALIHRGVKLIRMPSTVLAQNDAGIGVKNGVNAYGQKNFLGTFAPPHAVVNDLSLLNTLDDRAWRSGIAEAVKVAAIKDSAFFAWLEEHVPDVVLRHAGAMEHLIVECARLHVDHIGSGGDPFETGSARPLDFGHWSAHWLEMESQGRVTHGEAVAAGLAIDTTYALARGYVSSDDHDRMLGILRAAGFSLWYPEFAHRDRHGRRSMFAGLDHFREHLGGELTLTLPKPLGARIEIHEVDLDCMSDCIDSLRAYE